MPEIMAFVKDFTQDDYEISLENNNAYLTDEGAAKAEAERYLLVLDSREQDFKYKA